MGSSGFFLATLLVAAITLWVSAFLIWPAVARARFIEAVSEIRDEADDAILAGRLPDIRCVRFFTEKADAMIDQSGRISLSLLIAIHFAREEFGAVPSAKTPTYGALTPEQRRLMHDFDRRIVEALTRYIIRGSRFAVPLLCLNFVGQMLPLKKHSELPRPKRLAAEYNRLTNQRSFQHA